MGSNYFGSDANHRDAAVLSSSSSSSSRKGKKNGSHKPKQPQRGLGVAQLEKIRLHSQMECNYLPNVHNFNPYAHNSIQEDMGLQSSSSSANYGFPESYRAMMRLQEIEGATVTYGESQNSDVSRTWQPGNIAGLENQEYQQPSNTTRSFCDHGVQESITRKNRKDRAGSFAYNNQNQNSDKSQDIDLELRL